MLVGWGWVGLGGVLLGFQCVKYETVIVQSGEKYTFTNRFLMTHFMFVYVVAVGIPWALHPGAHKIHKNGTS